MTGNLYQNGSLISLSLIQGIKPGTAISNKALVLSSDGSISNISSLTSNVYMEQLPIFQFMNCDILSATINCNAPAFFQNGVQFITDTQDLINIDSLIFAGTKDIRDVSIMDFNTTSQLYKTILRKSTISSSKGIQVYDTNFSTPTNLPVIDFRCDNNSSPIFFRMSGYLNNNSTMVAGGQPHEIRYQYGSASSSGLNITCTNTVQASNVNYNVVLTARNGTIPHVVVNDSKNQLHLYPQGLAELNTSYAETVIIGKKQDFGIQVGWMHRILLYI
jgi:hypothetical protein